MAWRETFGGGAGAWKCLVFLTYCDPVHLKGKKPAVLTHLRGH